jgi:hypothetical protein
MYTFGPQQGMKTGRQVRVISNGDYSGAHMWGITLAPALVPRNGTAGPIVLPDDTSVPVGGGWYRFGQILVRCTIGANIGLWGPYDPASAADGRDTLVRSQCGFLDETWLDIPTVLGLTSGFQHPAVFDAGCVDRAKLLITTGAASLAAGPTKAAFEAAFPRVTYAA